MRSRITVSSASGLHVTFASVPTSFLVSSAIASSSGTRRQAGALFWLQRRMMTRFLLFHHYRDTTREIGELLLLSAAVLLLTALDSVFGVLQRWLVALTGERLLVRDLRVDLYSAFLARSLLSLQKAKMGELLSRLTNDVVAAQQLVVVTVGVVMTAALAAATFVTMLALEWRLTLLSLVTVPLSLGAVRRVVGLQRECSRRLLEHTAEMTAMSGDTLNIGAAVLIKLFESVRTTNRGIRTSCGHREENRS